MVLDEVIDAASARAATQAGAQLGQVGFVAVRHHFHVAVFGVAHPAAQVEFAGLAVYIPAEAHALHATLNQEMKDHKVSTKASLALRLRDAQADVRTCARNLVCTAHLAVYDGETMRQATLGRCMALVTALLGTLALCAAAQPTPAASPLVVSGLGRGTAALDGPWEFRTGDKMAWAAPDFDDSSWEQIDVGKPWGDQGHWAYWGFAWYRRRIEFKDAPGVGGDMALFMPLAGCRYEVYWNGRRVNSPLGMPVAPSISVTLPQAVRLGEQQSGVLAIRAWAPPPDTSHAGDAYGLSDTPRIGNYEAIANLLVTTKAANFKDDLVADAQILTYLQLFVIGLVVLLRNRKQKLLLWMVLYFFSAALWIFLSTYFLELLAGSSILFSSPFHSLEDIALWYLLLYLLDLDRNPALMRLTRVLAAVALVSAFLDDFVFSVPWSSVHPLGFQILDAVFTAGFSLPEIYPLVLIPFAFRKHMDPARRLVAVAAFVYEMFYVVWHSAMQGQRFTHWELADQVQHPLFFLKGMPLKLSDVLSLFLLGSIINAVYRYSVEQARQQRALLEEYRSAQELQRMLIPEALPALPGYAVTSAYRPAAEVGGDFFQLIPLEEGSTLVVIGDVSGKGLKAAMTVSLIVGALHTVAEISDDPGAILAGLNRRLHGRLANGFVTCLVLRISPSGECLIANAGHLAPFLNDREVSVAASLPLGVVDGERYESAAIHLDVDDRLTLYTDGLLEARNGGGELFSFERLSQLMAARPDAAQAVETAVAFGQEDDVTVVTLTRLATGVESTTSLFAPELAPLVA